MSEHCNILNFIRTLCANGESGRLEILAGAIQGELSFAEGKLVDARFGHLTGFPAVNAVAAMRDARFSFDPSFAPLASSSITASERVVLKQFFGIETVAANEYLDPVGVDWPEEAVPVAIVSDAPDEVTIVSSDAPSVNNEMPSAPIPSPLPPPSRISYRRPVAFLALAIALIAAGAVLMYKFNQSGLRQPLQRKRHCQSPERHSALFLSVVYRPNRSNPYRSLRRALLCYRYRF